MVGFTPFGDICSANSIGATTATSKGTTVTGSGSTNTKGSYTQITASSPVDAAWMCVCIDKALNASANSILLDIAIGAAASELVIAANLMGAGRNTVGGANVYMLPCSIPAGTRISARLQSATASMTATVTIILFDDGFTGYDSACGADSLGANTATSLGVQLSAGTANTKTAYSQLVASTSRDYAGLMLGFDFNNSTAGTTTSTFLLDIAIGAAAAEKDIIPQIYGCHGGGGTGANINGPHQYQYMPIIIPAGSRLSCRYQCSSNSSPANNLGVSAYGVYF